MLALRRGVFLGNHKYYTFLKCSCIVYYLASYHEIGQFVIGKNNHNLKVHLKCNISKTSASVSSGVPNTEKQMKARGRRPSAFIVSRCLEPLMKHEARVFEMASQTSVKISWNFFRRIGHQKV